MSAGKLQHHLIREILQANCASCVLAGAAVSLRKGIEDFFHQRIPHLLVSLDHLIQQFVLQIAEHLDFEVATLLHLDNHLRDAPLAIYTPNTRAIFQLSSWILSVPDVDWRILPHASYEQNLVVVSDAEATGCQWWLVDGHQESRGLAQDAAQTHAGRCHCCE